MGAGPPALDLSLLTSEIPLVTGPLIQQQIPPQGSCPGWTHTGMTTPRTLPGTREGREVCTPKGLPDSTPALVCAFLTVECGSPSTCLHAYPALTTDGCGCHTICFQARRLCLSVCLEPGWVQPAGGVFPSCQVPGLGFGVCT